MKKFVQTVNNNESKHSSLHDVYVEITLVLTLRAPNS